MNKLFDLGPEAPIPFSSKDLEKVLVFDSRLCYGFEGMDYIFFHKDCDRIRIDPTDLIRWDIQGISKDLDWLQHCLNSSFYLPRKACEQNDMFVQPIPYVVIRVGDKVLTYKRAGHETRLTDKYSIGFGGHINKVDFVNAVQKCSSIISECAKRELLEELKFDVSSQASFQMTLNHYIHSDLSSVKAIFRIVDGKTVNAVHLGVLLVINFPEEYLDKIFMLEEGKELEWKTLDELTQMDFEDWSKLVIEKCL